MRRELEDGDLSYRCIPLSDASQVAGASTKVFEELSTL